MHPPYYFIHPGIYLGENVGGVRGRVGHMAEFLGVKFQLSRDHELPSAKVFNINGQRPNPKIGREINLYSLRALSPSAVAMTLFIAHAMQRLPDTLAPDQICVHANQSDLWCNTILSLMNEVNLPVKITQSTSPNPTYAMLSIHFDQSPAETKAILWYGFACGVFQSIVGKRNLPDALPTIERVKWMHDHGIQGIMLPVTSPPCVKFSEWDFQF